MFNPPNKSIQVKQLEFEQNTTDRSGTTTWNSADC